MRSIIVLSIGLLAVAAAGSVYGRSSSKSEADQKPEGKLLALLVAGSNGWYNYRHQADVAHSYHVLKDHGVPEENIIVMMYDDIANHFANPYPGKLFNNPNWEDCYEGVKIDYKGESVNPENFLNVLKGNSSGVKGGNGRVIESGPDDRLFVYLTDHGSTGLISFPDDDILSAKDLNKALSWMSDNKRFADLVFYLETCESGSMFNRVMQTDINVYAMTAANWHESSYATYCDNERNLPCLGDLFSVSWMDDSDVEDLTTETIGQQFTIVKKDTDLSEVCHYGKMETETVPVSWFQGAAKKADNARNKQKSSAALRIATAVSSREVEIKHLESALKKTKDHAEIASIKNRLQEIKMKQFHALRIMKGVVSKMYKNKMDTNVKNSKRAISYMERNDESSIVNFPDCHHEVVHAFRKLCINPKKDLEYFTPHIYVLNNMCNAEAGRTQKIMESIMEQCPAKSMQ